MDSIKSLVEERFSIDNEEVLKDALSMGKGVIMVTAQLGRCRIITMGHRS